MAQMKGRSPASPSFPYLYYWPVGNPCWFSVIIASPSGTGNTRPVHTRDRILDTSTYSTEKDTVVLHDINGRPRVSFGVAP